MSSTETLQKISNDTGRSSVNAPISLTLPSQSCTDNLQDLLARMREAKKNRTRFHLTETDCSLMCTNSSELLFAAGQVIAEEGAPISAVYRIKKGLVSLVKSGTKVYDISVGHFIGEGLFIRGDAPDRFGAALVANGPVVVTQLYLPYVQQLLDVDKLLAFKIYRHIAGKLSGLVVSVVAQIATDSEQPFGSPRGHLSCELSMIRLDTETMAGVSGSEPELRPTEVPFALSADTVNSSKRSNKKSSRLSKSKPKTGAFKRYALEVGTVTLKEKKITITNGGLLKKRKIKYNEILEISKTGLRAITIIYDVQSKTLAFKNEADFHEFYSITQFFLSTSNNNNNTKSNSNKFSSRVPLFFAPDSPFAAATFSPSVVTILPPSPLKGSPSSNPLTAPPQKEQQAADSVELLQLAVKQDVKKGDLVLAEGDLYQRMYTIVYGKLQMKRGGKVLGMMEEGDVFGLVTLFHLRPSIFDVEVVSDYATVLIIPGYRIHDLVNTNLALAARIYNKAAQQIYTQIEKLLTSSEGSAKGLDESHFLL